MKYRRHPYGKITSSYEKFKARAQVNSTYLVIVLLNVRSSIHHTHLDGHNQNHLILFNYFIVLLNIIV
jgi:hypothetical protein